MFAFSNSIPRFIKNPYENQSFDMTETNGFTVDQNEFANALLKQSVLVISNIKVFPPKKIEESNTSKVCVNSIVTDSLSFLEMSS